MNPLVSSPFLLGALQHKFKLTLQRLAQDNRQCVNIRAMHDLLSLLGVHFHQAPEYPALALLHMTPHAEMRPQDVVEVQKMLVDIVLRHVPTELRQQTPDDLRLLGGDYAVR